MLHLPEHIRRLGPAALFATEAFESFNAIIRAKSVHSNRQAPSRDIARAFAQGNRIRHLLSGGFFIHKSSPAPYTDTTAVVSGMVARTPFSFARSDWRAVGDGPRSLIGSRSTITGYLGLDENEAPRGMSSSLRLLRYNHSTMPLT